MDISENAERALRMVREAPEISYDTETSGLDWKIHAPIGFIVGAPSSTGVIRPSDVVYVPIRHGGGGNIMGGRPLVTPTDSYEPHLWEMELARAFDDRNRLGLGRVVGHHTKFDCHFSANVGVMLGRKMACTQNQEAMLNEYAKSFSLESCAERHGVTAKKGDELYRHMSQMFGGPAERSSMQHFWRTAGNDPLVVDYATGDGVSTYELYLSQQKKIIEEEMEYVANLENDLIWTVFRMERRGVRVDPDRIDSLRTATEQQISKLLEDFPIGFNTRSPLDVKNAMIGAGLTDWPTTEKGNPSFTEKWLKKSEIGRKVIEIRQYSNLINSFVNPLAERHMFKGRVHATLNQLKSDDKGTISGRFSCSDPNLQQIPKRIKTVAKPFRRLFVADEGYVFWERDFSQCFVAGTQVSVPNGTKNIEDMKPGDWVYTYTDGGELTLKKVTWAGCTGRKPVFRAHWMTNGRTRGHVDCTYDHRIRKTNGEYVTVEELDRLKGSNRKWKHPLWVPVLALRRGVTKDPRSGYTTPTLFPTGGLRLKESRVVFEAVNGWCAEEVHHIDENPCNNNPVNLEGLSSSEHKARHLPYGAGNLTPEERKERSKIATEGLLIKFGKRAKGNHAIIDIEDLNKSVDVYDITVEDTHNFIANEICVHNCEPRLFAHYAQDPNLLKGYNSKPFVDAHTTTANLLGVERDPTAKRLGMGLLTGMQSKSLADHMGWTVDKASHMSEAYFKAFPGIQIFQNKAKQRFLSRGYVHTVLGRRCRLEDRRFAYRGTSRIIQGSNADIVKQKLLDADRLCEDNGDIVQVLMTVHDSYNGQYQNTPEARALFEEMVRGMEDVQSAPFDLSVPFVLEGEEGGDWCEATFGVEK